MYLFKKKKLNLREIHKLYLLLNSCLPKEERLYLLDEVDAMLEKMTEEILSQALIIIYKKEMAGSTLELLALFMTGLQEINFFGYVGFVGKINGRQ